MYTRHVQDFPSVLYELLLRLHSLYKTQLGVWGLILGLPLTIYVVLGNYVAFLSISMLIHKILGLGNIMRERGFCLAKSYNKELYLTPLELYRIQLEYWLLLAV